MNNDTNTDCECSDCGKTFTPSDISEWLESQLIKEKLITRKLYYENKALQARIQELESYIGLPLPQYKA